MRPVMDITSCIMVRNLLQIVLVSPIMLMHLQVSEYSLKQKQQQKHVIGIILLIPCGQKQM